MTSIHDITNKTHKHFQESIEVDVGKSYIVVGDNLSNSITFALRDRLGGFWNAPQIELDETINTSFLFRFNRIVGELAKDAASCISFVDKICNAVDGDEAKFYYLDDVFSLDGDKYIWSRANGSIINQDVFGWNEFDRFLKYIGNQLLNSWLNKKINQYSWTTNEDVYKFFEIAYRKFFRTTPHGFSLTFDGNKHHVSISEKPRGVKIATEHGNTKFSSNNLLELAEYLGAIFNSAIVDSIVKDVTVYR